MFDTLNCSMLEKLIQLPYYQYIQRLILIAPHAIPIITKIYIPCYTRILSPCMNVCM